MRSLNLLIELYPDKTGKELIAIQNQDKIDDEKEWEKQYTKKIVTIADINSNGGFYRGVFGNQYHYYKIYDAKIFGDGSISATVDSLYIHVGAERGVLPKGAISIERKVDKHANLENYGLSTDERVTQQEWDEVNTYIDSTAKLFW